MPIRSCNSVNTVLNVLKDLKANPRVRSPIKIFPTVVSSLLKSQLIAINTPSIFGKIQLEILKNNPLILDIISSVCFKLIMSFTLCSLAAAVFSNTAPDCPVNFLYS